MFDTEADEKVQGHRLFEIKSKKWKTLISGAIVSVVEHQVDTVDSCSAREMQCV